jgi:hypothetical protein
MVGNVGLRIFLYLHLSSLAITSRHASVVVLTSYCSLLVLSRFASAVSVC